ncbi:MAG TPA: diaminopimelate epimerase [Terriglobales bacterium]|nr:diaminopimelate epimerase [Terriglobales bacterium]
MSAPQQNTKIPFTKASACGNDFLLVEGAHFSGDLSALTRRLCDRHRGVGADGVEWLFPDAEADVPADVKARLINSDGSEAEISGNGTRCVAAEICSREDKKKPKTEVVVRTGAGLKTCRLTGRQGSTFEFEADMGPPEVGGQLSIETIGVRVVGIKVSMGNPHFVIFVENFQDGWQRQAALIQTQPQFPQGTNVVYVVVRGASKGANRNKNDRGTHENRIEIRIFERGAGETESSGTGSCAAAVAAIASGRVASPVTVIAPGGAQTVRWENQVYLRGPATLICRGEFFV